MKPYPEVIEHHCLTFKRSHKLNEDMTFTISYRCDQDSSFPALGKRIMAFDDFDQVVDEFEEQFHAYVGNWLANFWLTMMQMPDEEDVKVGVTD